MTTTNRQALKDAVIDVVDEQVQLGFSPHWVLAFHYGNPYERGWRVYESATRWGYKIPTNRMLWDNVGYDKSLLARRNDTHLISKDAQHVRNLLLQRGWGVSGDLRKHDECSIPMLFVHERGKEKIQCHTHLILPALPAEINNPQGVQELWKHQILPRAKSLSRTNSLSAERVFDIHGLMRYLTKEVHPDDLCVDYHASCLITPEPSAMANRSVNPMDHPQS
jgi:hypothetical protein